MVDFRAFMFIHYFRMRVGILNRIDVLLLDNFMLNVIGFLWPVQIFMMLSMEGGSLFIDGLVLGSWC